MKTALSILAHITVAAVFVYLLGFAVEQFVLSAKSWPRF